MPGNAKYEAPSVVRMHAPVTLTFNYTRATLRFAVTENAIKYSSMPPLVIESHSDLKDHVGKQIATTDWLTVTQDRIQQFADATGDHQWIHVDVERSKRESPYKNTSAHGFLTLSLLPQLMPEVLQIKNGVRMGINYGLNRVRFVSP